MSNALANVTPIRPDLRAVEQRVADTDDGYTRLANELLEELIGANLTRNQAKVAFAVCRKTYGFNKKTDRIADSQISQLTKLPRQKVNKAKNELIAMKVLIKDGLSIGPNKNLSEWSIPECHHDGVAVTKSVTKVVTKTVTGLSPKQGHTKDTITKEKKESISSSRNSDESRNDATEKFLSRHPEAADGIYTPAGKAWGTADDLKAARWIFDRIAMLDASVAEPGWPEWANTIRLMRQQDGRTHHDICELFRWANKHHFWSSNILSPASLRKQWGKLTTQRKQGENITTGGKQALDFDNTDWAEGLQL